MYVPCFALQSAPGFSIAAMQYTQYSNNRQVFRAPCQMSWERPGSVSTLMDSMAAEVTAQETRKKGQGPGREEDNVKLPVYSSLSLRILSTGDNFSEG